MQKTRKIAWQKYEDVIENQIKSPLSSLLMQSIFSQLSIENDADQLIKEENEEISPMLMVPENLSNEIQLLSNFDCWVGHTNFNITEEIKNTMNRIDGIEVLKICSRYRFFIGVGKCFNFKEVREEIEKQFISKGNIIEKN